MPNNNNNLSPTYESEFHKSLAILGQDHQELASQGHTTLKEALIANDKVQKWIAENQALSLFYAKIDIHEAFKETSPDFLKRRSYFLKLRYYRSPSSKLENWEIHLEKNITELLRNILKQEPSHELISKMLVYGKAFYKKLKKERNDFFSNEMQRQLGKETVVLLQYYNRLEPEDRQKLIKQIDSNWKEKGYKVDDIESIARSFTLTYIRLSIEILATIFQLPWVSDELRHTMLRQFTQSFLTAMGIRHQSKQEYTEKDWLSLLLEYSNTPAYAVPAKVSGVQKELINLIAMLLDGNALHNQYQQYAKEEWEITNRSFIRVQYKSITQAMFENIFEHLLAYLGEKKEEATLKGLEKKVTFFLGNALKHKITKMYCYENRQPNSEDPRNNKIVVNLYELENRYFEYLRNPLFGLQENINQEFTHTILSEMKKALKVDSLPEEIEKKIRALCQREINKHLVLNKFAKRPEWLTITAKPKDQHIYRASYQQFERYLLKITDACTEKPQYGKEKPEVINQLVKDVEEYCQRWIQQCETSPNAFTWVERFGECISEFSDQKVKPALAHNVHGVLDEGKRNNETSNKFFGKGFLRLDESDLLDQALKDLTTFEHCYADIESVLLLMIDNTDLFQKVSNDLPIMHLCHESYIKEETYRSLIKTILARMDWQLQIKLCRWANLTDKQIANEPNLDKLRQQKDEDWQILSSQFDVISFFNNRTSLLRKYIKSLEKFYNTIESEISAALKKAETGNISKGILHGKATMFQPKPASRSGSNPSASYMPSK